MSPPDIRRALMRLAGFAAMLCIVFAAGLVMAPHSASRLRHDLGGLDAWGPVVAIALGTVLTCAFVPGPVLAGASGLLFGTALGTAVAVVSATLGATAAFLIARLMAQRPYGTLARGRLRTWTTRIEGRGFIAVLYARVAPVAPFALISYAAGMTRIRPQAFAAATAIGALPRAFAYAALGGTLGNYSSPQALTAIGVLVAMTIGGGALVWQIRRTARTENPSPAPRCPSQR